MMLEATLDQLHRLKLFGMAEALSEQSQNPLAGVSCPFHLPHYPPSSRLGMNQAAQLLLCEIFRSLSRYLFDVSQIIVYTAEVLTVLTVIWAPGEKRRIISFRRAHKNEREAYHAWLEKEFKD